MTIQELAAKYASMFITKTRKDGDKFLCVKDSCKDESLTNLIHSAHDGMLPDDYKYEFIHEALEAISETDDIDDISLEPDIYNHDLLKWVSSNLTRAGYVDQAVEDGFEYSGLFAALTNGQSYEKNEVLQSVISSLLEIVESQEDN